VKFCSIELNFTLLCNLLVLVLFASYRVDQSDGLLKKAQEWHEKVGFDVVVPGN
jgi:thiamine monophosphate kinase